MKYEICLYVKERGMKLLIIVIIFSVFMLIISPENASLAGETEEKISLSDVPLKILSAEIQISENGNVLVSELEKKFDNEKKEKDKAEG
jgi:hypothetical protein